MRGTRRTMLCGACEGQEERLQLFEESAGQIAISERSVGPATNVVYGLPSHRHRVLVKESHADRLAELLGCERSQDIELGLARYFGEGRCLLDLEDDMDRLGLPYAYEAQRSGYVVFRPSREELDMVFGA